MKKDARSLRKLSNSLRTSYRYMNLNVLGFYDVKINKFAQFKMIAKMTNIKDITLGSL